MGGGQSGGYQRVQPSLLGARIPSCPLPSERHPTSSMNADRGSMTNQKGCYQGFKKESILGMVNHPDIGMQIIIDALPTRNKITLQVTDWDTIRTVKEKIQDKEGIPADQQTLIHAGRLLEDHCILAFYGVHGQATFHMIFHPIPKTKISVETPTNGTITLEMDIWNTIEDIKTMMGDIVGLGPNLQKLMYDKNHLKDNDILADHNIKTGTTLGLVVCSPIQIFVKMWSGKTITIEADPSDAVQEVMAKIQTKQRTPTKHQILVFGGKRLKQELTLGYYNIHKESTLHLITILSAKIELLVFVGLMNGETMRLAIKNTDTGTRVKEKIYHATGIPTKVQMIWYGDNEIKNDQTVGHYSISHGSTLIVYKNYWSE